MVKSDKSIHDLRSSVEEQGTNIPHYRSLTKSPGFTTEPGSGSEIEPGQAVA
jgi:hypothetical protein